MAKKKPIESEQTAADLDGKVQTHEQTDGANDTNFSVPAAPSTGIKEVDQPKPAITTKTAAEVVSNAQGSNGPGMLRSGALVFSGGAGTIKDDVSATTREVNPYRSGMRSGRRVDSITRKIDYLDAEVIKTKVFESKPLSETSDKQGYPGNYFNEHAISQKANGGVPAEPLYERSVDEIDLDMLYYPDGQRVKCANTGNIHISSWDEANNQYEQTKRAFTVGNFLARSLTVTFNANGQIENFTVNETDCSVDNNSEVVARASSDASIREINQREIDRNVMITKAGNESDPSWSPMGDVVIDPSDQNRMLAFLEALAGDNVFLSRYKTKAALSYQINKAAKDGSRIVGPMAEMVNGNIELEGYGADGAVSENNGRNYAFAPAAFKAGGAGLWLALNDSLPKYTSKGKLLTLPLSFKSVLGVVDSNADPLRVHKQLVDELTKNELFSTIDGPYDPLKPIVVTDKAALFNPISLMTGCTFNATTHTLDTTVYVMHYENLRNRYNYRIRNYFMEAIFRWISERGQRFYQALAVNDAGSTNRTVTIPIVSSTTSLSLWDLIVLSATPYMIEARLVTMTELLKYEGNHGYPYTGLVSFKEVKDLTFDNFTLGDPETAISCAVAKPVAAIKVMFPEVFWPISKRPAEKWDAGTVEGVGAWVVLPHYFNQAQFKYTTDDPATRQLLLDPESYASMSYPSTRSGSMLSFLDTVYGMSEEDYRLALDRMTVYPAYDEYGSKAFRNAQAATTHKNEAYTYKYGLSGDGIPVIGYMAYASKTSDRGATLQVRDILSTPRELGLMQVAPAGVLTPVRVSATALNLVNLESSYLALSGPGFRAKVYHAEGTTQVHAILAAGSTNFDNSASLRYVWTTVYANPYSVTNQQTGIAFSAQTARVFKPFTAGSYDVGYGTYNPQNGIFDGNETQISNANDIGAYGAVNTAHAHLWTRLQRLPFVVNPFDCNRDDITQRTQSDINSNDIFDMMYIFGFEGFRTSDYSELVYERSKQRIALGMNYVNDPFVDKSMLLK